MRAKRIISKIISVLLIACMLPGLWLFSKSPESVTASVGSNWAIIDPSDSDKHIKGDFLVWQMTHASGENSIIRYRTSDFRLSRSPFNTSTKFSNSPNSSINTRSVGGFDIKPVSTSPTTKVRKYSITRQNFITGAIALGVSSDSIVASGGSGVPIYINPVYDRYKGDYETPQIIKGNIFGLQEMLEFEWSDDTRNKLPSFYNKKYIITPANLFTVDVIITDNKLNPLNNIKDVDNKAVSIPLKTQPRLYTESFNYEASNKHEKITADDTRHEYTKD